MKRWIALFICALMLLIAAGCSNNMNAVPPARDDASQTRPSQTSPGSYPEAEAGVPAPDTGWGEDGAAASDVKAPSFSGGYGGHKIIKNASLGLETREFDAHVAYIKAKAEEMGGYVSSSYVSGKKPENYNDAGRYANVTLRIPQERMEAFLADTRGLATVTFENAGSDDITATYFDTESRVKVYTEQRERILELLSKAETMEDIIALETELSRLTYEIEALTTDLRRWDDLIEFATVSIDVAEIPPASAVAGPDSMGMRISEGFRNTLSGVAVFFEGLLVFLLAASPVLVILAIIAVVIILLVRRGRKKRKARMGDGRMYYQQPNVGYGAPVPPAPPMPPAPPQPGQPVFIQGETKEVATTVEPQKPESEKDGK